MREKRFRFVHDQPNCSRRRPTRSRAPRGIGTRQYPSVDCRSALYKTGFIELNEDGSYVDPAQERKVLALIDAEKRRGPDGKIITFLYVHGWKNNGHPAAPGEKPQDVERFSTGLAELGFRARLAAGGGPAVPIVGVYIGWRGKSLRGPSWFTFVSYWSRRNTANRVGGGSMLPAAINDVIEHTNAGSEKSRVILVGHSFGARVLEHAIENGVRLYDEERVRQGTIVRPRVDLVLYVNSANDARLSMGRVQALQKNPITVRHPDTIQAPAPPPRRRSRSARPIRCSSRLPPKAIRRRSGCCRLRRRSRRTGRVRRRRRNRPARSPNGRPRRGSTGRRGRPHAVHALAHGDGGGVSVRSRRGAGLRRRRPLLRLRLPVARRLRRLLQGQPYARR